MKPIAQTCCFETFETLKTETLPDFDTLVNYNELMGTTKYIDE